MKSNDQITSLLQQRKFDGVRYACIDRLTLNRSDSQGWLLLGYAMVGLKRTAMAKLCFERASLLNGFLEGQVDATNGGREDKQVLRLLQVPQVKVSACMLVRDSARTIAKCIESLQEAVDEIIVVDTGSKDDTVQIVESFGIPVHPFDWINDFSAARTYAQSFATFDWVIHVDSDEILWAEDKESIRKVAGFFHGVHGVQGSVVLSTMVVNRAQGFQTKVESVARMFRRDTNITWHRRIHEYPAPEDVPLSSVISATVRIRFLHDGYDPAKVNTKEKFQRNISLLLRDLEEHPNDPRTLHFIGREYFFLKDIEKALVYLRRAKECAVKTDYLMIESLEELFQHVLSRAQ